MSRAYMGIVQLSLYKPQYVPVLYHSIQEEVDSAAYDTKSSSIIKLNNNTVLYLREVNRYNIYKMFHYISILTCRYLALVCLLREESFSKQGDNPFELLYSLRQSGQFTVGLIDYNFYRFRDAIQKVC